MIAILATISTVAYSGLQDRARNSKISADLVQLDKAIRAARVNTGNVLIVITGTGWTAGGCFGEPVGTNLADLDKTTNPCWTQYITTLQSITTASGINITGLVDPSGWPYYIDENEQEQSGTYGPCGIGRDAIGAYRADPGGLATTNVQYVPYITPGC